MKNFSIEITDTFGGEANYCWVKRFTVKALSKRGAIIKAKREGGWRGYKHRTLDYGDMTRLDLKGACVVIFIE